MNNFDFSELTLDNVGQWPSFAKYFIALLLAIIIFCVGYWLIVQPNFTAHDLLLAQQEQLKSDFEIKQQLAANLQAYKNQLALMDERFGNMLKKLPQQDEMAKLLEEISKTGTASGLTFELFAPMPEVVHDFYIELPINIKVLGNYHQLALFLSRVVEMSRIVTLHDFDIVNASKGDKQISNGDLLEMTITAKIYRYRTQ